MTDKTALRRSVAAARAARSEQQRLQDRAAIRSHVLAVCRAGRVQPGSLIAAYEPLRTEPGSTELLAALIDEGHRLIVPVTLSDRDLDWTGWPLTGAPAPGSARTRSPTPRWCWSRRSRWTWPVTGSAAAAAPTTGRWPE